MRDPVPHYTQIAALAKGPACAGIVTLHVVHDDRYGEAFLHRPLVAAAWFEPTIESGTLLGGVTFKTSTVVVPPAVVAKSCAHATARHVQCVVSAQLRCHMQVGASRCVLAMLSDNL